MEIGDKDFEREVLRSELPVLVEFWGSWCPPCQKEKYILEKLEKEYDGKMKIATINVDRNPVTAFKYKIKCVPTYIIFHGGEIIHMDIAAKSERQLRKMIEEALRSIP
jgi:thioredoxin 1